MRRNPSQYQWMIALTLMALALSLVLNQCSDWDAESRIETLEKRCLR